MRKQLQIGPVTDPFSVATLAALRGRASQTLSEIAGLTRLSRPTVLAAATDLERHGLVERLSPAVPVGAGRPAMRFGFVADAAVIAGVDIGVHKIVVLVQDLNGKTVGEHRVETSESLTGSLRVRAVVDAISDAVDAHGHHAKLIAVGLGAPGISDATGRITFSPALREWEGIDLGPQVSRMLGAAVFVESDTLAATFGEFRYGAGRGTSNFVYLLAGFRTAAGSVVGGRIHRGASGAAGAVGEMRVLQWADSFARLISDYATATGRRDVTALEVFDAAHEGHSAAVEAVERYVDAVAVGLAALSLAIDPELIVVGGGISKAGPSLAAAIRDRLAVHAAVLHPRVEISELGDRAVAVGAARLALDHVESHVLGLVADL
ncbi:hypothetical protein ASE14_15005 [Agromyces sp. Root81]|uniref:ROK family protein n=1 Tax=Agromyces sp. Root81 TaxID=1736601 RepID=UPI0006FC395D|nr:ROK family protein [Agromyces sp. Root81]KRC59093.1 hypothetical protein ASE14_15005 [Agromyces sp. Root81]